MSDFRLSQFSLALPPAPSAEQFEDHLVADPKLLNRWFSETLLLWSRWGLVGILLLLAILFPRQSQWLTLFLATSIAAGNVLGAWLLHQGLNDRYLQSTALLGTVLEWSAALGISIAFRRELDSISPYVLLLFLFPVSYRYGLRGLLLGLLGIGLAVTAWFGLHFMLYDILTPDSMRAVVIEWTVFLLLAALLSAALIVADLKRSEWEHRRLETFRRERAGLSSREWEVLLLVAQSDLTYDDIGYLLNISPETVKTHVRRIGEKLAARGRAEVVQKAREQQLISNEVSSTVNGG